MKKKFKRIKYTTIKQIGNGEERINTRHKFFKEVCNSYYSLLVYQFLGCLGLQAHYGKPLVYLRSNSNSLTSFTKPKRIATIALLQVPLN